MEELHHGILDSLDVIASLIILEEEGKIVSRSFLQITPEGKREIHEFKLEFGSDGDNRPTLSAPSPVGGHIRSILATKQNLALGVRDFLIERIIFSLCLLRHDLLIATAQM